MFTTFSRLLSLSSGSYVVDVTPVTQNLSITPSDMLEQTNHGFAVSSQLDSSMFSDGDTSPYVDLPLELRRGVDINDAWQASKDARQKIRKLPKSE